MALKDQDAYQKLISSAQDYFSDLLHRHLYSYPFVLELMYQQVEALNSVANSHNACGIAKNSELQLQIRGIEKKRWVFVGLLQAKQRHLNY